MIANYRTCEAAWTIRLAYMALALPDSNLLVKNPVKKTPFSCPDPRGNGHTVCMPGKWGVGFIVSHLEVQLRRVPLSAAGPACTLPLCT